VKEHRHGVAREADALIDETLVSKVRPWDEWTGRMRMSPEAKSDLERFVLAAPAPCRT
jgi:hypothetical protein